MRPTSDVSRLKSLGENSDYLKQSNEYKYSPDVLETFNSPDKNLIVKFSTREFTSLCPKTNQPDYGAVFIIYSPKKKCIESKSLKLYLMGFRNRGDFGETIACTIRNDLAAVLSPNWMRVIVELAPRGGIGWTSYADSGQPKLDGIVSDRQQV